MSEPESTQQRMPWNGLAPQGWVQRLVAVGLRPAQAYGAVKGLAKSTYRTGTPWHEALAETPRSFRQVAEDLVGPVESLELCERVTSSDQTSRLLLRTHDGHLVETVIIPSERGEQAGRTTVCVSSQVGCGRRCVFCETGKLGLVRQLSTAEIVAQLQQAHAIWRQRLHDAPPITNVVFMGMGEPLDNLDAVLSAIDVFTDDLAFGLAARRITVSTVGVAPKIGAFVRGTKAHLAVSLNAPDDVRRSALMPVNRRCSLSDLKHALVSELPPGRDVLFEYILFDEVNDSLEDAHLLGQWLRGVPARLNLIPANPGPDPTLRQPRRERVWTFQKTLLDMGLRVMVRHPHGRDVGGACGQLAGAHRTSLERLAHTRRGEVP